MEPQKGRAVAVHRAIKNENNHTKTQPLEQPRTVNASPAVHRASNALDLFRFGEIGLAAWVLEARTAALPTLPIDSTQLFVGAQPTPLTCLDRTQSERHSCPKGRTRPSSPGPLKAHFWQQSTYAVLDPRGGIVRWVSPFSFVRSSSGRVGSADWIDSNLVRGGSRPCFERAPR